MLTDLSIAKNRLRDIQDDALGSLRSLVSLDLHQNQLQAFYSVPQSKSFDSLLLAYNGIDELGNLERAPGLTIIDVHNNKLTSLPDAISELTKLKTLKISNNDLADLNPRISLLPDLVRINIEGNPLKCIKSSLRGAGAEQLKKYLKTRLSENEITKEEIKQGIDQNLPGATG